jgi:hypothetical protein
MQTTNIFLWLSPILGGLVFWLAGCQWSIAPSAPPDNGSCILQLAEDASDEASISAVLAAEGQLVVKQDIDQLMKLWAEGGQVTNAKNTPGQTEDDQHWLDKDAIRHRYVRTVFPGAPQQAAPADLVITIQGDQAVVTATTQIGNEVSPAGDRWILVKQDGCWLIESLTYNLELSSN